MTEETKLPEENVEVKVEEQAEAVEAAVEEKVEETQPATEETTEPTEEKSCCAKSGGHINFWKLATVFLLLAWAVQNWRITKAEEEAKKKLPFYRSALSAPSQGEEAMLLQAEVGDQLVQAQDYVSTNPRGIAPTLSDNYDSLAYRMFIPGLKDYKVNVSVKNNVLTVSGLVTVAKKKKGEEGVLMSESKSQFANVVKLPCAIKVDKIKVVKTANELKVIMPKVVVTAPEGEAVKKKCCPIELKKKAAAAAKKAATPAKK